MQSPKIIYETKDFLAVDKPAGLMVHAVKVKEGKAGRRGKEKKADEPTLVDWLVKKYPAIKTVGDDPAVRPGIVHRLDKDTSGVMLVAKNQDYFAYLKALFQKHEVKKTYRAIVFGIPKKTTGIIDAPIGIRSGTLKRSTRSTKMQKEAVTRYRVMETFAPGSAPGPGGGTFAWLEVYPETGRTHQIRVHLTSIGHPIVGDRLYGPKTQPAWAHRLMLHAAAIEFREKDGSIVRIDAM